ncbi:MAG: hypothetical protein JO032_07145 [Alphaproteobacteria bacterium]|nr:hypothetical protein [Alphaproteobacteria bacterium]
MRQPPGVGGASVSTCAFILDDRSLCGQPSRAKSAYCDRHHTLCHLTRGSRAERLRLRQDEALAEAVGGKRARSTRAPPDGYMQRMAQVERACARKNRSRIVHDGERG